MNRATIEARLREGRAVVTARPRPHVYAVQIGKPGPIGPPGPAGAANPYAYSPMLPGRWWYTNPSTSNITVAPGLGQLHFQPLWTGDNTKLSGLHVDLPNVANTGGNVLRFALYTDSDELWPYDLVADLGQIDTTTVAANTSKVLQVDQAVYRQNVYWLCTVSQNGTGATFRCSHTAHPLVGMFDTAQIRDSAPSNQYAGFYIAGYASGPFPARIDPAQLLPIQALPRLMVRFGTPTDEAQQLPGPPFNPPQPRPAMRQP